MTWTVFLKMLRQMAEASVGTLTLFFLTLLLALPLGLLVAQGRMSRYKWISWPVRAPLTLLSPGAFSKVWDQRPLISPVLVTPILNSLQLLGRH